MDKEAWELLQEAGGSSQDDSKQIFSALGRALSPRDIAGVLAFMMKTGSSNKPVLDALLTKSQVWELIVPSLTKDFPLLKVRVDMPCAICLISLILHLSVCVIYIV
jgi:hypothetical protein